jgi:mono/diheme cytochrome c family protein
MTSRIWLAGIAGSAVFSAVFSVLNAQAPQSVWDGVYTAAQAARGAAIYEDSCSSCHATDLLGAGPMPALTGPGFRKEWNGQPLGDLFERMSVSMPADKPGKLTRDQDADVLAFILKSNDFPAGKTEMKGSTPELSKIKFVAAKP